VTGVTGERNKMENRVENLIAKLKKVNTNPIAVGFGISTLNMFIKFVIGEQMELLLVVLL